MFRATKRQLLGLLPPSIAGRLRAWRVRRLIRGFPARVVEHSYGGRALKVYLSDPLARGWYDHDWSDLPEIVALRDTRLRPGGLVFDIRVPPRLLLKYTLRPSVRMMQLSATHAEHKSYALDMVTTKTYVVLVHI